MSYLAIGGGAGGAPSVVFNSTDFSQSDPNSWTGSFLTGNSSGNFTSNSGSGPRTPIGIMQKGRYYTFLIDASVVSGGCSVWYWDGVSNQNIADIGQGEFKFYSQSDLAQVYLRCTAASTEVNVSSVSLLDDFGGAGVQSVSGALLDNSDPQNPIVKKGASFFASNLNTNDIIINDTPASPSFLGPLKLDHADEISLVDAANGTMRNDTGRLISMTGSISYNPDKGGGGTTTLNLISERSNDNGATWFGNVNSRRTVEISNNGESFGTKISSIIDWEPGQLLRFRAWRVAGSLSFVSTDVAALGETYTTPSIVWELSEI